MNDFHMGLNFKQTKNISKRDYYYKEKRNKFIFGRVLLKGSEIFYVWKRERNSFKIIFFKVLKLLNVLKFL